MKEFQDRHDELTNTQQVAQLKQSEFQAVSVARHNQLVGYQKIAQLKYIESQKASEALYSQLQDKHNELVDTQQVAQLKQSELQKESETTKQKYQVEKDAVLELSSKLQTLTVKSTARMIELEEMLRIAGVTSDTDLKFVTAHMRSNKRRRTNLMVQIKEMEQTGVDLEEELLQQREGEPGSFTSMPHRFVALREVNEYTNGKDDKIVHALIKFTIEAIGENLNRYSRTNGSPRAVILGAITRMIEQQCQDNPKNLLASNVSITNHIFGNIKRVHHLKYGTHCDLGQLYRIVRQANQWFHERGLNEEFQLAQQKDLERILGINRAVVPTFTRYNPADIRKYYSRS